jgi:hypothetical protein
MRNAGAEYSCELEEFESSESGFMAECSSRQRETPAFGRGGMRHLLVSRVTPHGRRTRDHGLCPWGSMEVQRDRIKILLK